MLQLEPGMIIWTWVTFLVLLFVLKKVAWKPLLNMVEERENRIAESLKRAEEARMEAEKLLEEQHRQLAKTQEEVQAMLKESRLMAEKVRNDIIEKAREDANKLMERARRDIEKERQMALMSLRNQVADLVVQATSKLIQVSLDEDKHRELIDEYIQRLDDASKN